jgi:CRISPR-associated protein Csd1
MGLFQKAVETYDNMKSLAGAESEERKAALAPIGFITTGVQIEITVTEDGEFRGAEQIFDISEDSKGKSQKSEKKIIIPVTEKSLKRTNTAATSPHPLCDKLMYMCPENKESYEAYLEQLQDWCDSEFACPKIKAILKYVKKGTIQADIASVGKIKVKKDTFVCWRVLSTDCAEPEEVWKSRSVIDSYINYYQSKIDASPEKALCYVSGELIMPADKHPGGVVSGMAKLISSNDKKNFTYKGRFSDDSEALTVGFISSQKAHNALKWVVSNDGFRYGNRMFVCWNPKGKKTKNPFASLFPDFSEAEENPTPTNYRKILAKTVLGYKNNFKPEDETVTAVFEAISDGRISVCYYSEMKAEDFLERLRFWDETTAWLHRTFGVTSPNLRNIADAAYGVPRTIGENQTVETDEKVLAIAMQRLLLCRLEKAPFPADIMRSAVQKCSSLQLYDKLNREKQLFTTCAIIKKYIYDRFKEEWNMALEPEKKNRSYQFGRLLAVLEKAERDAFDNGEKREPNAIRMWSLFVKRPMYATTVIIEQLKNAYYPRLEPGERGYYDKLIEGIMRVISEFPENEIGKPLGEEYLMGYYLQKDALYPKKNNDNDDDNNESEDEEQ